MIMLKISRRVRSCLVACLPVQLTEWADPIWRQSREIPQEFDQIMNLELHDRFHSKQGRSIVRWELGEASPSLVLFLKRHYVSGFWKGFLARFLPDRWFKSWTWCPSREEYENLQIAAQLQIPVPRLIAMAEKRGPGFALQGYLALEELAGMEPLHLVIPYAKKQLSADDFAIWKKRLIEEMVEVILKFHLQSYFHKDLYLCHFYLPLGHCSKRNPEFENQIRLIDFHRFNRHRLRFWWFLIKDLGQLWYSSQIEGIEDADRSYFWDRYRQAWEEKQIRNTRFRIRHKLRTKLLSLCRPWIRYRGQRYCRHNQK